MDLNKVACEDKEVVEEEINVEEVKRSQENLEK